MDHGTHCQGLWNGPKWEMAILNSASLLVLFHNQWWRLQSILCPNVLLWYGMGDLKIDTGADLKQRTLKGSPPQTPQCVRPTSLALKQSLTSHISYYRMLGRPRSRFTRSRSACGLSHLLQLWLLGFPNTDSKTRLSISASGQSPQVKTHFFSLPTCHPARSTLQAPWLLPTPTVYCCDTPSASRSFLDPPPQLPAHRTQDPAPGTQLQTWHNSRVVGTERRLPEPQRAGTRQAESMSEGRSCTPQERDSAWFSRLCSE